MVKFILIEPNDFFINQIDTKNEKNNNLDVNENNLLKLKSNYVNLENLKEKLKDTVKLIDIEINENWMNEIVKYLDLDTDHYCILVDCYESKNYMYQIFNIFQIKL